MPPGGSGFRSPYPSRFPGTRLSGLTLWPNVRNSTYPGIPGYIRYDYPGYSTVPYTGFRCDLMPYKYGYYADVSAGCQVITKLLFLRQIAVFLTNMFFQIGVPHLPKRWSNGQFPLPKWHFVSSKSNDMRLVVPRSLSFIIWFLLFERAHWCSAIFTRYFSSL